MGGFRQILFEGAASLCFTTPLARAQGGQITQSRPRARHVCRGFPGFGGGAVSGRATVGSSALLLLTISGSLNKATLLACYIVILPESAVQSNSMK